MSVEFFGSLTDKKKKWTLVIFIFTSKIMTGTEYIFRCLLASFFYVNYLYPSPIFLLNLAFLLHLQ